MWAQLANTALGLWLMIAPGIWGFPKKIADNDHIVGPLIVTFAITALFENTRPVRKFNIPAGVWLLAAPWVLGYNHTTATVNSMVIGALVIVFALIKGQVKSQFGGGWSALWQDNSLHEQEAKKKIY